MIDALIAGKLIEKPERRVSKDGVALVKAVIRARIGKTTTDTWELLTHDRTAMATLLTMQKGDALAARGTPMMRTARIGTETIIQKALNADTVLALSLTGGRDE